MFKNGQVLVQKFGGSSMGSVERIKNAAVRIAEKAKRGYPMVVVVSAMGDTTDELIELIHKISAFPKRREIDNVMATGEMVSASLMASALIELGVNAKSFNAFNLQLFSEIAENEYYITKVGMFDRLEEFLKPGAVAVVAGFQGITNDFDLTTLGRGGSDLTAVVMSKVLGQKVCEKFTDEDGVYTADPRIIPTAAKVWHLNYDEMLMLAKFGNGILHPRAISSAKESDIRIHVRSSFSNVEGSVIGPDGDESIPVKSITCSKKYAFVRIMCIKEKQNLINFANLPFKTVLFQQTENYVAFGFDKSEAFEVITYCWEKGSEIGADRVETYSELTTISLVGCGLATDKAIAEKYFKLACRCDGIVAEHSGIRFSVAVPKEKVADTLTCFHNCI